MNKMSPLGALRLKLRKTLCFCFSVFKRDHLQSFNANRFDDFFYSVVNFAKETWIKRSVFAAKNNTVFSHAFRVTATSCSSRTVCNV